jgi:hypothetical protein
VNTVRSSLETILNKVDFTAGCCRLAAPVGAALPEEDLVAAGEALKTDVACNPEHRAALFVLLDKIDFTHFACSPFEMVGACIPPAVLTQCRRALEVP